MKIKIGSKHIGEGQKVFIVAELSANHKQDKEVARDSIYAIKDTGADAVKLQTYTPDTITIDCKNDFFKIKHGTLWDGKTLYELYKEAYTPWDWHYELKELAESLGLVFFSTPFDKTAVDFLENLQVPAYKIASFEITDIPLIEYIATKGKPVIISTGIASISEIHEAVSTCKKAGNDQVILLKCTSAYPAPFEEINLKTIPHMAETFNCIVGLSDHTLGIEVPIAAVTLGAKLIEKHFILDKNIGGPDAAFSLEPEEFKKMVSSIRNVEKAIGTVNYEPSEGMRKSRVFSRSLFAIKDIKKGEIFTESNIRSIRPGLGLHPRYLNLILGKKARKDIKKGSPLNFEHIDF